MDPIARIKLDQSILDTTQSHSIKVIEVSGQIKLCITIGIIAQKITSMDHPSEDEKEKNRDATLGRDLLLDGSIGISLKKIPATPREKTANFKIEVVAHSGTKIPGTGSDILIADLA